MRMREIRAKIIDIQKDVRSLEKNPGKNAPLSLVGEIIIRTKVSGIQNFAKTSHERKT
jgi:hypothetical protein